MSMAPTSVANATFAQLGGSEGYAEFDESTVNGSLTVNQSTTAYSYFEAVG